MRIATDRPVVVIMALLGAGGMSVALGDPPAAADTPPSSAAPVTSATSTAAVTAPAAADANASAAASAKTASAAQTAADDEALEKRLTNSGYKSKMRNGQKVWCKRQDELGSRLGAQEVCATPDEWRRSFRDNQEVVERIQKIDGHVTGR